MTDDALTPDQIQQIRDRVADLMPQVRADLEELVRIPSVSASSFDQSQVARSAEAVAELLRREGLEVEVVVEGGRPAVIGHLDGPEGAPTVTLYAHHDVQPPGDDADWDSSPFEPEERGGRLYGRGAADDKAGVMAHVAALRAHAGNLPVGVTVFVEGEEESGSPSLGTILEKHGDRLAADAIVIADSGNWDIGTPALTTTLRGGIRVVVQRADPRPLRALRHVRRCGARRRHRPRAPARLAPRRRRQRRRGGSRRGRGRRHRLRRGRASARSRACSTASSLIGSGSILSRLWNKPSITTIGIDATSIDKASNTLSAKAAAKISVRLAPTQDPLVAFDRVREHLEAHAPWGARLTVELEEHGSGFAADADGPVYDEARASFADAWGTEPVDMGVGGSIPFISDFSARFPNASIIVTGVEDPDTRAHGANESLHLAEFEKVCVAEAVFLARLGALRPTSCTRHDGRHATMTDSALTGAARPTDDVRHGAASGGVMTPPDAAPSVGSSAGAAADGSARRRDRPAEDPVAQLESVGVGLGHPELAGHGDLGLDVVVDPDEADRERPGFGGVEPALEHHVGRRRRVEVVADRAGVEEREALVDLEVGAVDVAVADDVGGRPGLARPRGERAGEVGVGEHRPELVLRVSHVDPVELALLRRVEQPDAVAAHHQLVDVGQRPEPGDLVVAELVAHPLRRAPTAGARGPR